MEIISQNTNETIHTLKSFLKQLIFQGKGKMCSVLQTMNYEFGGTVTKVHT